MREEKTKTENDNKTVQPADSKNTPPPSEKTLFTWKAPARMFKRRSKEFWTKTAVLGVFFATILYISEGVMPVILLMSAYFLFYILSTIEPENIDYKITNIGLYVGRDRTNFSEIIRFWFTRDGQTSLLNLDMFVIPGRIAIPINGGDEGKIRTAFTKYVIEEVPQMTQGDKVSNWISNKLQ